MASKRKERREVVAKIELAVTRKLVVDGNSGYLDIFAMRIVGLSGHKHIVAHFLPIDIQFEVTKSANENVSVLDGLVYLNVLSEQRCIFVEANPFCHPIRRLESCMEAGWLAPF